MKRKLLMAASVLSLLLCLAVVVLRVYDQSNLSRGKPVVTLYSWGDENVTTHYCILLGLGHIDFSSSWGYKALPPGQGIQHIYMPDTTFDTLGFRYTKSTTRPEAPGGRILDGVYGDDSSFGFSLGWPLFLSAILPVKMVALGLIRYAHRKQRRIAKGMCPTCSYDLRGNTSGVCPECGMPVDGKAGG